MHDHEKIINTRSVLEKTICSVIGGKFSPPTTKCYNFEFYSTILVKFGEIAVNMARKRIAFENLLQSHHVTLKCNVTWKEAFFKMSSHIYGCICAIGEIWISIPTYLRSRITIVI